MKIDDKVTGEPAKKDPLIQEFESLATQQPDLTLLPFLSKLINRIIVLERKVSQHESRLYPKPYRPQSAYAPGRLPKKT